MRRLFISDLHLCPSRPALTELACRFLSDKKSEVDELYILGDLFNVWFGDDVIAPEHIPFIDELKRYTASGIKVFIMVGNRDFMLKQRFTASIHAKLIDDPYQLEIAGTSTLLMHGDSLCTDDVSYQKFRRFARNPIVQWLGGKIPIFLRKKIASKIKKKSAQQKQYKSTDIMDVNQKTVRGIMQQSNTDLLIHGHTHRPAIHRLDSSSPSHRIVLGDWSENLISYLYEEDGILKLIDSRVATDECELRLL